MRKDYVFSINDVLSEVINCDRKACLIILYVVLTPSLQIRP